MVFLLNESRVQMVSSKTFGGHLSWQYAMYVWDTRWDSVRHFLVCRDVFSGQSSICRNCPLLLIFEECYFALNISDLENDTQALVWCMKYRQFSA